MNRTAVTNEEEGTPLQSAACGCGLCAGKSPVLNIGGDGQSIRLYPNYNNQSPEFVIRPGEGGWYHTNGLPYWIEALMPGYDMVVKHDLKYYFSNSFPSYPLNAPLNGTVGVGYSWENTNGLWDGARLKAILLKSMRDTEQLIDIRFTETNNPDQPSTINYIIGNFVQAGSAAMPPWTDLTETPDSYDRFIGIQALENPYAPLIKNGVPVDGAYDAFESGEGFHELGHNLGLSHPFDMSQIRMPGIENNTEYTLMAYSNSDPRTDWYQRYGTGFKDLDLAALQYLYGPSKTVRTGNDTYRLSKDSPNFVWDGVGVDTVDASDQAAPATLSLVPGYWGYIGATRGDRITAAGQVTVNYNSTLENLVGTAYGDRLTGNEVGNGISGGAGNDTINGGQGDDQLVGGEGIDTATYLHNLSAHVLTRQGQTWTVKDTTPDINRLNDRLEIVGIAVLSEGTDTLNGIERLRFADTSVALDMGEGQSGNQAARLVGVLGKAYLSDKTLMGVALSVMDAGMGIGGAAQLLLNKGIMSTLAGGADDTSLAKLLVKNVLGREASAADLALINPLTAQHGQQWLITTAANLEANATQIDLVGLSNHGMAFV